MKAPQELLNSSFESRDDQRAIARKIVDTHCESIFIFGAGGLGQIVARGLKKLGVPIIGFIDNNPSIQNTMVMGLEVFSPEDSLRKHKSEMTVILAVWRAFATETLQDRKQQLINFGFDNVISFHYFFWDFPEAFPPHFSIAPPENMLPHSTEIMQTYDLLSDSASKETFLRHLTWRLDPEHTELREISEGAMYTPSDLYIPIPNETYVDCGGFDGDTLQTFLDCSNNSFSKAVVFEPDPTNFRKLQKRIASMSGDIAAKIVIVKACAGLEEGTLRFADTGTVSSQISEQGSLEVQCHKLDSCEQAKSATLIKMDIEGAEYDALLGAKNLIAHNRPYMTVCLYHRQEHLWNIPNLIESLTGGYRYFMRCYGIDGWDLVLYAIPRERKLPNALTV
jgi:FkbM family methyltransferase